MRTLLVVVEHGAVTVREIVAAVEGLYDPVFLVPGESAYANALLPLLSDVGPVARLGPDVAADAEGLRRMRPDGIVTFSESTVRRTADLAARLGLRGHDGPTAIRLTDKAEQRRCLREHGIEDVATHVLQRGSALPPMTYPVIVKPVVGEGSRHTYRAADSAQATALVDRFFAGPAGPGERLLVEEFLVGVDCEPYGDYVSVESVCRDGRIEHLGITGKLPMMPPFRETGQFWPPVLTDPVRRDVLELTTRAVAALGVATGLTHTEVKLTPAGPRLIEVNGRIGGYIHELYRRARGIDLVRVAAALACGDGYEPPVSAGTLVWFQWCNQPPLGATALTSVAGAATVRRHPAVDGYVSSVAPGTALPADARTCDLDLLSAHAPSHRAMLDALEECLAALSFTFATPDGPVTLTGNQLRSPPHA